MTPARLRWSQIENFEKSEFDRPEKLDPGLIHRLDAARTLAEKLASRAGFDYVPRIYPTSDLREGEDGDHGSGEGLDISDNLSGYETSARWRHFVVQALYLVGFRRIGIYDRHIHIGVNLDEDQFVTWWGKSQ